MINLLNIIKKENIYLIYKELRPVGAVLGLYINTIQTGPIIVLDKLLLSRPQNHRCILAHEIGHYFHPPRSGVVVFHTHSLYGNEEIILSQDERKAMRYATNLLMPSEEVWKAISDGYNTIPLLADFFYVTEWFARAKINFMRVEEKEQGKKLKWRDIIRKSAAGRRF